MKSPLPTPPRLLRPHVALAVDVLNLANNALSEFWTALTEVPVEAQHPISGFDVAGWRETIKLFVELFAVEPFLPGMAEPIRDAILRTEHNWPNLPGLERAEAALNFAVAALDEATDVLDRLVGSEGDPWYGPLTAAHSVFGDMYGLIHGSVVGGHDAGLRFDRWRPSNN